MSKATDFGVVMGVIFFTAWLKSVKEAPLKRVVKKWVVKHETEKEGIGHEL